MVRILSVTLTRGTSQTLDVALKSVEGIVDARLVIVTDEDKIGILDFEGNRIQAHRAWSGRFDEARNMSLEVAAEACNLVFQNETVWALLLDDDEWITLAADSSLREELTSLPDDQDLLLVQSLTYWKEKLFRLPTAVRFEGRCHETTSKSATGRVRSITFGEHAKNVTSCTAKRERDLPLLHEQTHDDPKNPRWWYYLGDTLAATGSIDSAVHVFQRCAELPGWDEQAAWAYYRMAECLCILQKWDQAVQACASGLSKRADVAELAWLASWASYQQNRYTDAEAWALMSISLGEYRGLLAKRNERCSFRYPYALYEGPFDVLSYAAEKMNRPEDARFYRTEYEVAKEYRLQSL